MTLLTLPALIVAQENNLPETGTQTISSERQAELIYMVQQDCGSCHGMTLKGGLGPSLLPERVSVLPEQYLIDAVTHGRQGTPMPPWEPILTQNEIKWVVEQLQLGQLGQKK
ncbi:MAG: cytochrome c [Gammaproteobacteria bacterium]|nr:MAG: cytochrome c [Gammaproteobacteria bacterium]